MSNIHSRICELMREAQLDDPSRMTEDNVTCVFRGAKLACEWLSIGAYRNAPTKIRTFTFKEFMTSEYIHVRKGRGKNVTFEMANGGTVPLDVFGYIRQNIKKAQQLLMKCSGKRPDVVHVALDQKHPLPCVIVANGGEWVALTAPRVPSY